MIRYRFFLFFVGLFLLGTFLYAEPSSGQDYPVPIAENIALEAFTASNSSPDYLDTIDYDPRDAQYFEPVNAAYQLNEAELALLAQNGFVVSDRLFYQDFIHAYAWIYWKDLPVLITTDSMLQSVHYAFSEILFRTELAVIGPSLDDLLQGSLSELREYQAPNSEMAAIQADLDIYLSVALALLRGQETSDNPSAIPYIQQAMAASEIRRIDLFNSANRQIDFTRFEPLGLYYRNPTYYRAMMWLSQIDMRLVDYSDSGEAILNPRFVSAAILLQETMNKAGTRGQWDDIESLLQRFFGISDNTSLFHIDRLIADAGFASAQDALEMDEAALLELLTSHDYGQQRITGQVLNVSPSLTEPLPRPISFLLFGQRFSIDSYIMSNLTFDRLQVEETLIHRPFPSTMDVMFALGNNRALNHLVPELEQYNYQGALQAQRNMVDGLSSDFWMSSSSSEWLNMLRYLSDDTTGENYPQAMRTDAWADRMLQTQLASWAQLRHDTLLYSKESYTGQVLCEYPAGYVEPYPAFYAALAQYAQDSYLVFSGISTSNIAAEETVNTAIEYYMHLQRVATQLEAMSQKIINHEPFSADEEAFLRDITVLQNTEMACGLQQEEWDGWYADLYPWYAELNLASIDQYNPMTIATVHTNTNRQDPSLMPPGVLHVATGRVSTQLFIVNTHDGLMIYAGPVFSYYEFIQEGYPPQRLTDVEWAWGLGAASPPDWTASFRISRGAEGQMLIPGWE